MSGWLVMVGIAGGHMAASLVQTLLHRAMGHGALGGLVRARHVDEHHSIYSARNLEASHYSDEEKSLSVFYLIPAGMMILPVFLFFVPAFAIGFAAGLGLSYLAHIYLHAQYHLTHPKFGHHGWFRKLRDLHMVHHLDQGRNFAVIDLYWDKLMGTFRGAGANDGADGGWQ
ncbi:MAG: sterol desaturase family protein [Stenotrophobium sp.]